MVKIAFITTTNSLNEISRKGDIEFCLAPFCKDLNYRKYFKTSHKYVILDNGVAENNLISNQELINLAISMKVSELIIPDIIGDYKQTKIQREEFLDKYYDILNNAGIRLQGVVQGRNLNEYEESLKELKSDFRIYAIGMPFRMHYANFFDLTKEENYMMNRLVFFNRYLFFKPVHFLGCNLPSEIKKITHLKEIRSIDTKLFSRYGLSNKIFNFDDKVKPKKKLFINDEMTKLQIKSVLQNIDKLKGGIRK